MALSVQQLQTLKTDINADPAFAGLPLTSGSAVTIATAYNLTATPDYWVERTSLSRHEILTGTSLDGTTFAWAGGAYITRSQGERDAFREMFNSTGTVNPSLASIKAAFNDIFSGTGGAGNRAHIVSLSRRKATRFEKLFAAGAGTTVAPSTMSLEGTLTADDVQQARELP